MGKGREDGKVFTYRVWMDNACYGKHESNIQAETPAKAKYAHYQENLDFFNDYAHYIQARPRIRKLGEFKPSDLYFEKTDSFLDTWDNIKKYRRVPFIELGMKVDVNGKSGIIVGNCGLSLAVCMNGNTWWSNCHPNWRTKYYNNDGKLLAEFGD